MSDQKLAQFLDQLEHALADIPRKRRDPITGVVDPLVLHLLDLRDEVRRLCRELSKARQGNAILLRAMRHAGRDAVTGEWPSAEWCKRRCLEVG